MSGGRPTRLALAGALLALAAPFLAAAAPDWTARIPELAPALRACLAGAGGAAYVTEAATGPGGIVRVLLWQDGAAAECRVPAMGGAVQGRRIMAGVAPPDSAAPAFFLDRRCVDARRVDAADGTVLGWIAYPAC
jgi:hypothetical protein